MPEWARGFAAALPLDESTRNVLKAAMEELDLSARAYDRILKVARTSLISPRKRSRWSTFLRPFSTGLDRQIWT